MASLRPSEALAAHRAEIRALVARYGMSNPRVFGSAARGEDGPDSDLDLLVEAAPRTSLLRLCALQVELEDALGVKVDLRTPRELSPALLSHALAEARPV